MVVSANRNAQYGIGTYTNQIKKFFLKYKYEFSFSLIMLDCDISYYICKQEDGIWIHYIPHICSPLKYRYISIFFLLKKNIQNIENSIFIFNFPIHYLLLKTLKERCCNIKLIFVVHLQTWSFVLNGNENRFKRILKEEEHNSAIHDAYKEELDIYNLSDKIVVLSLDTYRIIRDYYHIKEDKMSLIYNGIPDNYRKISFEENKSIREQFSLHLDEKIILYVGRIDSMKGVPATIEAFKKIVRKHPDSKLILVGEGEEMEKSMKLCAGLWNKILFTGRLNEHEIYKLYKIADIGIMLSMHEQCSYVAIEMLMHNLKLITTDTTGLNEMLKDNPYKINLTYTDYKTIIPIDMVVDKIEKALYNPIEYDFRGVYLSNYTMDMFFKKMYKEFSILDTSITKDI